MSTKVRPTMTKRNEQHILTPDEEAILRLYYQELEDQFYEELKALLEKDGEAYELAG